MGSRDIDREVTAFISRIENSTAITPENKNLILNFINEKLASGTTQKGSLNYHLKVLSRLGAHFKKNFREVTREELIEFFNNLKPEPLVLKSPHKEFVTQRDKYAETTLWLYKTSVKTFWKWLFKGDDKVKRDETGFPEQVDWIKSAQRNIKHRFQKDVLSREEVWSIIKCATNERDKAIIAVLYESGMRVGELLGMKIKDLQLTEDYCEFDCTGKTGTRRIILIKSYPYLKQWLDWLKKKQTPNPEDYLWLGFEQVSNGKYSRILTNKRITNDVISLALKKAAKRAKISKRVWVHGLRHSSATDFAKQGYNEFELRLKYGWAPTSNIPSNYTHYKYDELKHKMLARSGKHAELQEVDGEILKLKECPFCSYENPFDCQYCGRCARPLDTKVIAGMEKAMQAYGMMQQVIDNLSLLEKKGINIQQLNQAIQEWVKK